MDRLTSLVVFGRVVETGGFSAAARRLNMSVTMVSNHVQALEDRLGARLLQRTTRRVSLTEIGRSYYERSTQDLGGSRGGGPHWGSAAGHPARHAEAARDHEPRAVSRADDRGIPHGIPAVSLDLTVGDNNSDLIEDGYDLAIRATPPPDSGLIVRRLTPWRHVLCCAPAYLEAHPMPEDLPDLAHHNCLRYAHYPFGDEWRFEEEKGGRPVSVRVRGTLVTNSAETLRLMTLAGQGIMLAPTFLALDDLTAGRLVRLLPQHKAFEFAINAIYPSRHHLSTKVRSFIELLAERFAAHRQWMNADE